MYFYLQTELRKYYTKIGNKTVFNNGQSLNQIALEMWEKLHYSEIDKSVMSKVINGNRLFTSKQLDVFCNILKIPNSNKRQLYECLILDKYENMGISKKDVFFLNNNTLSILEEKINNSKKSLYNGESENLKKETSFIYQKLISFENNDAKNYQRKKINELLIESLYLNGRSISNLSTNKNAIQEISIIINKLDNLNIFDEKLKKLSLSYKNTLSSNAHYISGNYSSSQNKNSFYNNSINFAKKAIATFDNNHPEAIFAMRGLVASLGYLGNKNNFVDHYNKSIELIKSADQTGSVNALHLAGTISKVESIFNHGSPLQNLKNSRKYFSQNLNGKGIYEVSDIRNEIEIYKLLKIKDNNHIKNLCNRGIKVAKKFNLRRHIKSIYKLKKELI